jgi:ankyrin repeat protein
LAIVTLKAVLLLLLSLAWGQSLLAQGLPPLLAAARDADWDRLAILLDSGADVNSAWGDGSTTLHWSSYHDDVDTTRRLLARGADVNAANDLGATPLWLAAENASEAMTRLLLEAGADPSIALSSGETPLVTAALTGNAAVVKLLLAAGADPNIVMTRQQTPLMWAANRGHSEVVELLVAHGADVNARTEVRHEYVKSEKEQDSHPAYKYWIDNGGHTPLLFAARAGDLASARALVQGGAAVDGLSAFGLSPLIMAVHGGNAELVEFLLEQGAAVDLAASGQTALHVAILRGDLDAVEVLLEHGANPDAFLQAPTPVRRQTTDYNFHDALVGGTALWLAARFTEPAIMAALLEAGANPHAANNVSYPAQRLGDNYLAEEGEISVLMAAVGMGHRRLRLSWWTPERRAGITGRDQEALILAAVKLAVEAGVDLNLRDAEGQSALDFAKARRYRSVVDYLESVGAV